MLPEIYFEATAVFFVRKNRLYRIFIRSDELVFIWAGSGSEGLAGARRVRRMRGGLEGLMAAGLEKLLDPSQKNAARQTVLNTTQLPQLLNNHPKNLRFSLRGMTEISILPRSDGHARAFSDHEHQAIMRVVHESLGNYKLGIRTVHDVEVAMRELPKLLGNRFRAEIDIPQVQIPCGCRFCR